MRHTVLKTREIIDNMKKIMLLNGDKKRITDGEVAHVLNIPANTFTHNISRDSTPFREILEWCQNTGVGTDWVFFGVTQEIGDIK